MVLAELIRLAIDTAIAGAAPDGNMLQTLRLEAETLVPQALHTLARDVAGSFDLRARLEVNFSVTLTSGIGVIPAGLLLEYIEEGSVRDSDPTGNNGQGNIIQRIQHYTDFIKPLPAIFGYYCIVDNQILTRNINDGLFTTMVGPLLIDAPFIPTKAALSTTIPDELQDVLVMMLADRIKGNIGRMPVPSSAAE